MSKNKINLKELYEKLGPTLALIILVILVSILNFKFLDPLNLLNLLRQVSINALIAFGMQFVILTGGIDLSVGSILALSGAFTAQLVVMGSTYNNCIYLWNVIWCNFWSFKWSFNYLW